MSIKNQFLLLSEYNKLMNQRIYDSASLLSGNELSKDRGAFFKSIIGTLNHLLVGDIIWLKRFSKHRSSEIVLSYISNLEAPKSLDTILFNDLGQLRNERIKIDKIIIKWINSLSESDLEDPITYNNMAGSKFTQPFSSLINHLFLHQVHHRGQITTLLSQSDLDFGDTDLLELINDIKA